MDVNENSPRYVGRYEIKALLGAGAMGSVYLAEDPRIKRQLAIKVIRLDTLRSEEERHEYLARFQREAEVSGVLNNPGIVTIYDLGDSELGPYLAMEYVAGQPLDALIRSGEPLALKDKLAIAGGIAAALDHAHARGIVHRDVKPANVMITADHKPKLMDFGIAKRDDASLTATGIFLGTPSYASPEQIKEGSADRRSDLFSFGVLVFELLSGCLPFPGTSINTILYKIVNEPPAVPEPPVPGLLPEGWQRVFAKVLAKDPAQRHATCSAFVRDLLDCCADLGRTERLHLLAGLRGDGESTGALAVTGAAAAPPAAARRRDSRSLLWLLVGGGLVAVAAGGFLLFRRGPVPVLIDTEPPGAVVTKDGVAVGNTPVTVPMQAGQHLRLERKGFQPKVYEYQSGDHPNKLALEPVTSQEVLATEPPGATVVLDATRLDGLTPLTVTWNQGQKHDLTFTLGGQTLAFTLLEGETPGGRVFTLGGRAEPRATAEPASVDAKAPGGIRFTGDYEVHVRLDGKDLGPVRAGGTLPAAPGAHRLELANAKLFFRESRTVTVAPGQTLALALPGTARLTVETFPNSGMVVVDGQPTQVESDGATAITLTRGAHTVSIQGHPGSSKPVNVQTDMPLKFKL
jgi:tRNA A-37 threonylcarbamoyl transferase component Bud32